MDDILREMSTIAHKQWQKPTDVERVKAELVRRYGSEWEMSVMGFCQLHSGQEIYTALIADSPETTDYVHISFIVVEWDGSSWYIHETINTDGT